MHIHMIIHNFKKGFGINLYVFKPLMIYKSSLGVPFIFGRRSGATTFLLPFSNASVEWDNFWSTGIGGFLLSNKTVGEGDSKAKKKG